MRHLPWTQNLRGWGAGAGAAKTSVIKINNILTFPIRIPSLVEYCLVFKFCYIVCHEFLH